MNFLNTKTIIAGLITATVLIGCSSLPKDANGEKPNNGQNSTLGLNATKKFKISLI